MQMCRLTCTFAAYCIKQVFSWQGSNRFCCLPWWAVNLKRRLKLTCSKSECEMAVVQNLECEMSMVQNLGVKWLWFKIWVWNGYGSKSGCEMAMVQNLGVKWLWFKIWVWSGYGSKSECEVAMVQNLSVKRLWFKIRVWNNILSLSW